MSPATASDTTATESRRERQRRELVAEIKDVARSMLESGGRSGVSWRGIAREVGLNPASLYTYFPSLDDLFTELILDSMRALASAVEGADEPESPPRERTHAMARAYRSWALANRAQYNLLFTDQLPGYAAPPGGPTVEGQRRIFLPFLAAMDVEFGTDYAVVETELTPEQEHDVMGLFGLLHGITTLEVNHHVDWTSVDREQVLVDQLDAMLDHLAR